MKKQSKKKLKDGQNLLEEPKIKKMNIRISPEEYKELQRIKDELKMSSGVSKKGYSNTINGAIREAILSFYPLKQKIEILEAAHMRSELKRSELSDIIRDFQIAEMRILKIKIDAI